MVKDKRMPVFAKGVNGKTALDRRLED